MPRPAQPRPQGSIRRRGNSLQVRLYAGVDPLTGQDFYLCESTTDEAEAKRILNRFRAQVDEQRSARTRATFRLALEEWLKVQELEATTREGYETYVRLYIVPALGAEPVSKISPRLVEQFYAELRRCRTRCDGRPAVDHRVGGAHECRVVKHRRPAGRRPTGGYPEHDCDSAACTVTTCPPHRCRPLSNATISKIHFIMSGALSAAVRWGWIPSNPASIAKKPRQPTPQPKPPTPDQAVAIVAAAWEQDLQWGMLVWLVMVTGARRAELLALRFSDVDLRSGQLTVRRNYVRTRGQGHEKDTKTHQMRRIALDPQTVELLGEHRAAYESVMQQLGVAPSDEAFLFSYVPARTRPCDPSAVSHRYARMCESLGIDSHLHALRHYSATELISAGVDIRTVAGRLGHGGGGTTTLRVYAAWVAESDKRAADILGARLVRPASLSDPPDNVVP